MPALDALRSRVWRPTEPGGSLAVRADDARQGAQDKGWASATTLMKFPRSRGGSSLPMGVLANELFASEYGRILGLSVNEVHLCRLDDPGWGDAQGSYASLHCLVPEPFKRLNELSAEQLGTIRSGTDRTILANDPEFRAVKLFDQLILNGDRHEGNVLVSGGTRPGGLWVHFIDHGYVFGQPVEDEELIRQTEGHKLDQYVGERSRFKQWLDGLGQQDRDDILPLASRITSIADADVEQLVRTLPSEVASDGYKRVMLAFLRYHIGILREATS